MFYVKKTFKLHAGTKVMPIPREFMKECQIRLSQALICPTQQNLHVLGQFTGTLPVK